MVTDQTIIIQDIAQAAVESIKAAVQTMVVAVGESNSWLEASQQVQDLK